MSSVFHWVWGRAAAKCRAQAKPFQGGPPTISQTSTHINVLYPCSCHLREVTSIRKDRLGDAKFLCQGQKVGEERETDEARTHLQVCGHYILSPHTLQIWQVWVLHTSYGLQRELQTPTRGDAKALSHNQQQPSPSPAGSLEGQGGITCETIFENLKTLILKSRDLDARMQNLSMPNLPGEQGHQALCPMSVPTSDQPVDKLKESSQCNINLSCICKIRFKRISVSSEIWWKDI